MRPASERDPWSPFETAAAKSFWASSRTLAAFTRGRLLLENLHQPAEAALAFAQARSLTGASSALAEDALAREALAWGAAGKRADAARCANQYRTLYPEGAHLKELLRFLIP